MNTGTPESATIMGMECLGRKKAAEELGLSVSTLDVMIRKSRAGRMKVPLRFFQLRRSAPMWFPRPWLEKWVEDVADNGGAY